MLFNDLLHVFGLDLGVPDAFGIDHYGGVDRAEAGLVKCPGLSNLDQSISFFQQLNNRFPSRLKPLKEIAISGVSDSEP